MPHQTTSNRSPYKGLGIASLMAPETALSGDDMMPEDLEVILEAEAPPEITIDPETGAITVETEEVKVATGPAFDANLAEYMEEEDLKDLGSRICQLVKDDNESRRPWFDRFKKGLEALGIYKVEDTNETLGVAVVNHPLLIEAGVQFQARAMAELLPAGGPVKAAVVGKVTPEKLEQGERVSQYMNYQLTVEDRQYYDERDQMLFSLPFSGSEFDKQYFCPIKGAVVSRWVKAEDFIAPYSARNLATAPRYTHAIPCTHNQYRRHVQSGFYRDVDLDEPSGERDAGDPAEEVRRVVDEMDGKDRPAMLADMDKEHRFYETHIELDLKGYEEDIALPYIVTVDSETQEVLSVYRNWKEDDERKMKRVWFTHKKFLPGFGFYGFGLIHAIGGLGETATQVLRILLDSGAFATLQGGFKSKDAKLKGDIEMRPGEWADTEMTAEELNKAFYTPPFKEPSGVLFQLLGLMTDLGQRFAATTDVMMGDAATTGPVGTTVALIEQGSKSFSGIHKRLHKAFGDEFINISELNKEHLPETYAYFAGDEDRYIAQSDFDDRVDIIPVSDPNIFSSAQRIAMAQSAYQLAQAMPDLADRREAAVGVLEAMRYPDPERIFPEKQEAETGDPVTEGSLFMMGRPVKAVMEQNHQAHIMVHQMQLQGSPPPVQPAIQAHIMQHMAMAYRMQMQQMLGTQLPPMNFDADRREPMVMPLPSEVENQIAMAAAQAMQQMMQQQMAQQQAQEQQQQAPAQGAQPDPRVEMAKIQADAAVQREVGLSKAQAAVAAAQIKASADERIAGMELQLKQLVAMMQDRTARDAEAAKINSKLVSGGRAE